MCKIFLTFYLSNITQNLLHNEPMCWSIVVKNAKVSNPFTSQIILSHSLLSGQFFIIIKVFRCFTPLKVSRFFQSEWIMLLLPWKCLLTLILLFLFSFLFFFFGERKVSTLQLSYYIGF